MKNKRRLSPYVVVILLVLSGMWILCGCTRKAESGEALQTFMSEETSDSSIVGETTLTAVRQTEREEPYTEGMPAEAVVKNEKSQECYVHICGAVKNPGVYCMQQGDRIFEVIEQSGGFLEDACVDYVNQAGAVSDGCRIWIPTTEEAKETGWKYPEMQLGIEATEESQRSTGADISGRININTATSSQLCNLSGIGETKAEAIIAYRDAHGDFAKTEDIMKVAGIKQSGYDKIKDQITVGQE